MLLLKALFRSTRWMIACVSIQLVLFVVLAAWKRLAPGEGLPKKAIDGLFDFYGPGLDVVHGVLPDAWFAGEGSVAPILALGLVVVGYGVILGLAIAIVWPLLRLLIGRVLRRR